MSISSTLPPAIDWTPWIIIVALFAITTNGYALAAVTGGLLFNLLVTAFQRPGAVTALCVLIAITIATALKFRYWSSIDAEQPVHTIEAATGLGYLGKVRPLDSPHSQPNYVMREMGFSVGRKHRDALRRLVLLALFAVPSILTAIGITASPATTLLTSLGAVISATVGVLAERWLFFAEAEHVSMLYYRGNRGS